MEAWTQLAGHAVPFTLFTSRLAGLFFFAPILSSLIVPMRFKALLVFMLGAAVYPMVPMRLDPSAAAHLDVISILPLVVSESVIGFSMGLIATTPLMALEMAGVLTGQQMGLGLARVYNPEAEYDVDVLGQLLFYIASGVFFSMGGLEVLFSSMIRSFERVPVGGFAVGQTPLDLLVGVVHSSFELAMRVSAPVSGIIFLVVIVLGAITKTMPQINIMSVGFTIKIIAGLTMMVTAVYAVQHGALETISRTLRLVEGWLAL